MHFLVFLLWVFSGRLVLGNVSFLPIGFLEERMRKSNINKIQNPQRAQRTRPKKSKTVSVLHVSRFTHTTRQQNQNPQKSLSRLDLLLSFHRNKPKVELVYAMFCLTCHLFLFEPTPLGWKSSQDFFTKR